MTRLGWMVTTRIAALAVGVSMQLQPSPQLIWNASASVPIGLYAVRPVGKLYADELSWLGRRETSRHFSRSAAITLQACRS
jgi:type IV secretory pathway protease TraF